MSILGIKRLFEPSFQNKLTRKLFSLLQGHLKLVRIFNSRRPQLHEICSVSENTLQIRRQLATLLASKLCEINDNQKAKKSLRIACDTRLELLHVNEDTLFKWNEMGGTCGKLMGKNSYYILFEEAQQIDYLGYLGVDLRIILKLRLQKLCTGVRTGLKLFNIRSTMNTVKNLLVP